MDGLQLRDEAVRDRIRLAEEFLDPSDQSARSYRADIILMLNRGFRRLTVSLDEIRTHNRQLADGLLQAPFDFSQAFDQALKNTIVALPNRPAREASEDVVSQNNPKYIAQCSLQMLDVLLRLCRLIRRILLQPSNTQLQSPQSHGFARRNRHKVLPSPPEGGEKRALQRKEEHLSVQGIPGSDDDYEWSRQHKCVPSGG